MEKVFFAKKVAVKFSGEEVLKTIEFVEGFRRVLKISCRRQAFFYIKSQLIKFGITADIRLFTIAADQEDVINII